MTDSGTKRHLQLKSISAIPGKTDEYLLVFQDENGAEVTVLFRTGTSNGISFANPEPDIFMDGRADARTICAAVIAFHRAR